VEKNEDGSFTVRYEDKHKQAGSVVVGQVMMATGRRPNSSSLGLEVRAALRCAALPGSQDE
jgi:pyruvate/2-oxoglutarate dehydrogenase complex dihydrolipoamide dehydrogenase (E3) component